MLATLHTAILNVFTPLLQDSPLTAAGDTLGTGSTAPQPVTITLLDLVLMGGWFMLPLVLLLGLAIYLFVERYMTIRKANTNPEDLLQKIGQSVRNGQIETAMGLCQAQNSPFARMVEKGLKRLGSPLADISASIENEAKLEIQRLEKRVAFLATIAGAAPMIGFLGTVTGMITAFIRIAQLQGNVNPAELAGGIYEALTTTAAGLLVGIPAYVGYNVLTNMISSVIFKMEVTSTEFIDLLQEPVHHN